MVLNNLFFRVDGNNKIGLGHVYRCIALAKLLNESFNIKFLTKFKSEITSFCNFEIKEIPLNIEISDEWEWITKNIPANSIIVLDGYIFDEKYQLKIKESLFKLVYIDDLIHGFQHADLVINHTPKITKEKYKAAETTNYALGLNYSLLRKSFLEYDKSTYTPRKYIQTIFICFGGADVHDFTYQAAQKVLKLSFLTNVNVVIGNAYIHKSIFDIHNSKMKIHKNLSETELFNLMTKSDLAIVPASTISIELASLGVPMILGFSADNQLNIYNGFKSENVFSTIGNYKTFDFKKLPNLILNINTPDKLKKQNIINQFDNNSGSKLIKEFNKLKIALYKANQKDLQFTFELANDSLVRENSFNSKQIELKEHKEWFQRQLNSTRVLFQIVYFDEIKIGQVRFEIKEKHAVIGVSIAKLFRGKGFASTIIKKATFQFHEKYLIPVYAYVKDSNKASINSFMNAGYEYLEKQDVNSTSSNIYKKEAIEN